MKESQKSFNTELGGDLKGHKTQTGLLEKVNTGPAGERPLVQARGGPRESRVW